MPGSTGDLSPANAIPTTVRSNRPNGFRPTADPLDLRILVELSSSYVLGEDDGVTPRRIQVRRPPEAARSARKPRPEVSAPGPSPHVLADLQHSIGNRALASLLRRAAPSPAKADAADVAYWDDVFRLARKRIVARRFAEAEKLLRRVYEDPKFTTADSPGVVLNLALCRQQQGDFAEAMSLYQESMASPIWTEENRKELLEGLRRARLGSPGARAAPSPRRRSPRMLRTGMTSSGWRGSGSWRGGSRRRRSCCAGSTRIRSSRPRTRPAWS